uniref:Exocyst complex protein EXO70 n=1 Tax=Candidozyma auris TaxID=498019 RepID=A0A0L0NSG2_CANAR
MNVDIDEADVAVLTQNLSRSKELFNDITKRLHTISTKTSSASTTIKPVLSEFNALTSKKRSVDEGLQLLKDVSLYAGRAAESQRLLTSPIETVGTVKYLQCLLESYDLSREMKKEIHQFDNVVVTFANVVDKAEINVVSHFTKLVLSIDLDGGAVAKQADIVAVLAFFSNKGNLRMAHEAMEKALARKLTVKMAPFEEACNFQKRAANMPYERGSNGVAQYVDELNKAASALYQVSAELLVLDTPVARNAVAQYLDNRVAKILGLYCNFLELNGVTGQDLVILDVLDNLAILDDHLGKVVNCNLGVSKVAFSEYTRLLNIAQGLLSEWVRYVESRVLALEKCTDQSIPEVVVEVLSRIRRIAEYDSVSLLMEDMKLGSWLDVKPPLQFISVYTSVIPGAEGDATNRKAFLISSYILDLIDELMVNIEIRLKEQSGDNGLRKLTQGFLLVKNIVMIETIVNRLEGLYKKLGVVGQERLQRLKNRFLKLFLDDWNYASYIIIRDMTQITTTNAQHGGQNSNKEREQVKELFKNFNELFEEALKNYEKFNIQEKDLRNYLSSEIKKLIINAYNKLYDKYGSGDFTKNKAKYVKYDKVLFERLLNEKL